MSETLQTILALGLVGLALAYLLWRWLLRRRGGACDDAGCDCARGALRKPKK